MEKSFYGNIVYNSLIGYAYHEIILNDSGVPCDYRFIEVNPAFELFTGLLAKDIVGKTVLEVIPTIVEDEFNWIAFYGDVALHDKREKFESFSGPLDSWYKVEVFSPKKNFFITVFRDITKNRKQTQNLSELESVFSKVIKNAPIPIMIHSNDGKVLNISDTWKDISGYSLEDIPTTNEWTKRAYGIKQENVKDVINKLYNLKERQHDGEFEINTKDNRTVLWDFYSTYIGTTPDDHKMAMSVAIDVTEERKNKEKILRDRLQLETTLLSVGDGVICTNELGEITLINNIGEQLTGWSKEDALGKNIGEVYSILNEYTGVFSKNIIEKVIRTGIIHELANDTILRSKDGTERPIADSAAPIVLSNGEIIGAVLVFRDYTEKYQTQKEIEALVKDLQQTQLLLQASLNSPLDIIILSLDREYKYLYFNEAHKKSMIVAYNAEVEIGKCIFDYMTSDDDIQRIKARYDKALSGISHTTSEQYGDIDIIAFETMFNPIKDSKNNIIGVSAYARDISERIKISKQIIESEEKYRLLYSSMGQGLALHEIILDENENPVDYVYLDINDSYTKLFGVTREMCIGKRITEVMPLVEPYWIETFGKVALTGEPIYYENYLETTKKHYSTYTYSPRKGQFAVLVSDITERIEAQKNLENEKAIAQEYLNIAGVMILVLDEFGNVTLMNKKGCDVIGLNESEIVGKNWFDNFIPKDIVGNIKQVFKDVFNNGTKLASHYENTIINASGEERIISWYNSVLYDAEENVIGVLSSGEDVTDFSIANRKLIESEKRFRNLFEKAPFGYQSLNDTGHFIEVNKKWLEIFGCKREEVIGKWFGDFLTPDARTVFKERFEKFKKIGTIHSEFLMNTKDGSTIQVGFDGNISYDTNNLFKQTHCTVRDITELNIATEKLIRSEKQHRDLVNQMPLGMVVYEIILDKKGKPVNYKYVSCNDKFEEQMGQKQNDLIGKTLLDVFPNIENYWIDTFGKAVLTGKQATHEDYSEDLKKHFKITAYSTEKNRLAVIVDDITQERERQLEIEYLNIHDFLTGLFNRRFFVEKYKELDNPKHYPLGVMMIDVNGLKIINDAFGHDTGDIALQKVAKVLKKSFRKKDFVCRIGGDEFAVIVPNITADKFELIKKTIKVESKKNNVENVPLSLATGYEIKTQELKGGLDEILKLAENQMYRHKLTEGISIRNNAIKAILKTLTDKYSEERIHSVKVSQLCRKIGKEIDLEEEDLKELELAGMYHDIGKISIPDAILNKPGRLTQEEFNVIKTHPEISYQILRAADEYSDLAIHALHHHERWDGKGYPSGKQGEDIPLFSRIICVVDAFEAMTAVRVYKDKMSEEDAVREIVRCSGTQFDEKIAKVFVEKVLQQKW